MRRKQRKVTVSSTYLIMRERPEKFKGFFEVVTVVRTTLSSFQNDKEFSEWLFNITAPLVNNKRLREGDHIYIVRTQAVGERRGYHKIVEGRLLKDGFVYYDTCKYGSGHKAAKAIPAQPMSNQPCWQRPDVLEGFMNKPPGAKRPFAPRYLKHLSFI